MTFVLTPTSDLSRFFIRLLLQHSSSTCKEPRTLGTCWGEAGQGPGTEQGCVATAGIFAVALSVPRGAM